MPICIECRNPVKTLYTTYSKADDRSLGKGVKLTQCPRCRRFADKYVEHDFVILFIDMVLIKPQVYRHLLFNHLGRDDERFDPSIIRLGVLLLLFDVYLTWARIERSSPPPLLPIFSGSSNKQPGQEDNSLLTSTPLLLQYLYFLLLVTASTLSFHLPIQFLCSLPQNANTAKSTASPPAPPAGSAGDEMPAPTQMPLASESSVAVTPSSSAPVTSSSPQSAILRFFPYYPHPAAISTALLVSSCTKLFPILLIIWEYDLPSSSSAINYAVIANNIAAIEILTDCGYLRACILVGIGVAIRGLVQELCLGAVGLGGGGYWL